MLVIAFRPFEVCALALGSGSCVTYRALNAATHVDVPVLLGVPVGTKGGRA